VHGKDTPQSVDASPERILMHWGSDYLGSVAVSLRRQDGSGGYDSNFGGASGTLLSNEWILRLP